MINVLHYGLSKNLGGIETYLYKITRYIDKEKFQFSFIDTNDGRAALREELGELGCEFYNVIHRRVSPARNKRDLKELFCREKFDIFHCHINTLSYVLPIQLALDNNCRVIVHSRNAGAAYAPHTIIMHHLHRLTLPKKNITRIAVSDKAGGWLFGNNGEYTVYNNGIEIDRFRFRQDIRDEIRREWNLEGKTVIGVVGAFLPAKNHKFVVEIFQKLKKIDSNTILLLAGDGPLRAGIEKECSDKGLNDVMFIGARNDIDRIYNAMDIFLMPSLFEGFPNACLEAQTNGLPCLVSDAVTKEVDISNVAYLNLGDGAEKWARAIMDTLLCDVGKRQRMAALVSEKGFSVEDEVRRLERLYMRLAEGS